MKTFRIFYIIGFAVIFIPSGFIFGFREILPWALWAGVIIIIAEVGTYYSIKKRR